LTDILLPDVRVAKISPSIIDNTGRFSSPLAGGVRTVARPGDRWAFRLDYQNLLGLDRARFESCIASIRGAANRLLYSPTDYVQRGSFAAPELVSNGTFATGSTGWSTSSATLVVADRMARVQNSTTATGYIVNSASITTVSGLTYCVRAVFSSGSQSTFAVNAGTTSGASDIFASGSITSPGIYSKAFTASGTALYLSLLCGTTAIGDFVHYIFASVSRCLLVNGASQTGSALNVKGATVNAAGQLLPGDWCEINQEMKRITAPFNAGAAGTGYLQFSPPLRSSPADGAPIIINKPMGRFILKTSENGWSTVPGYFATSSVDLVEAPQ
jgi:hypothetical protein